MKEATNNSHFTLRDRIKIQIGLETGITIKEIADSIHFSRQKVYREIFNNGLIKKKHSPNPLRRDCLSISSYPFVCNNCPKKNISILKGRYYYADHAHNLASFRLHSSRSGSQLSKEQIASINSLVSPRLNNGQSIHHIYEDHKAELPICERTLRHMVNRNELDAKNLSLRRTIGRKLTHRDKSKLLPFDLTYFLTECMMIFSIMSLLELGMSNSIQSSATSTVRKSSSPSFSLRLALCLLAYWPLRKPHLS